MVTYIVSFKNSILYLNSLLGYTSLDDLWGMRIKPQLSGNVQSTINQNGLIKRSKCLISIFWVDYGSLMLHPENKIMYQLFLKPFLCIFNLWSGIARARIFGVLFHISDLFSSLHIVQQFLLSWFFWYSNLGFVMSCSSLTVISNQLKIFKFFKVLNNYYYLHQCKPLTRFQRGHPKVALQPESRKSQFCKIII